MNCKQFTNGTTCNECIYDLLSKEFVQGKDIIKLSKIAANILWIDEFKASYSKVDQSYIPFIKCNGNITIFSEQQCNKGFNVCTAQYIYSKLIMNWYSYYNIYKRQESYKFVKEKLRCINNYQHIAKIRTEAIVITKYLEKDLKKYL